MSVGGSREQRSVRKQVSKAESFLNSLHWQAGAAVLPHCGQAAVVSVVTGEQRSIPDEHGHSFQDEGGEELDVDEVSGTAEPPVGPAGTIINQSINSRSNTL